MSEQYTCSKPQFLKEVAAHQMTIARDDGLYRHLKFRKPGTGCYWFDIITWPGALCFNGDHGSWVFMRLTDMFEFFRDGRGEINRSYWSEKLVSCGRDGVKKYDRDIFVRNIVDYVRQHFVGEDKAGQTELFKAIREEVVRYADDEHDGPRAAYDFEHKMPDGSKFRFHDFWETDNTDWTVHFTWCLRAIVYALEKYDGAKAAAAPAPEVANACKAVKP